ncbi:MAG TPA: hypothetical protein PKD78_14940, partial [Saprospiraceae bacterium]|nr:hypothetical protein [Saprospiraceae bacterium]
QFTDTATTCSNLDERQVTVLGNTAIQPHDTLYCMVPGTLVNLPLHDLPGLLYFGPAVVQPGNRLNPTFYPKDTVVQVFFTLTNAAGCAYTASIKVALTPPLPPGTVQAGPDDTLCVYGPPLALLGFPANGTWACSGCPPGALLHPAAGVWQFDPKATAPGAGAFQLTYTVGADNCAQSDSRTIVVIAAAPNAGQPQAACKNAPMQTLSAAVPPPAGFSAYWTGVPGVTDTLKGLFAPMLAGEGAHPVSLHWLHAASGCVFSAGKSFVVHPLAGSSFSIQPPYCVGQALDVQNLTPGAASQTWYDNGKPISTQADPAGIQLDSGQHLIRLVSQTAEMCPDSAEQTIVVIAPPTLVSTPDKTQGCPPLWVRFQNQFTSKDTAYYRISAPGMAPYTVPATAADSLYFAAAAQDLTYTVQLVVENKCDKVEKAFSITALSRPDALFGVS